ncbi:HAD family hydrolase [Laceyella putida]|uniref:HAD family hydrolase n=1 Tax=Laceyella putida TaxID=110101 RepID=A0ABW2RK73_9BACL
MDKEWNDVKAFHVTFDVPYQERPRLLEQERVKRRAKWMMEEIQEFMEADTLPAQADAMIDTIYLALGTLVEMGVKPDALFQVVHEANMSKLWEDGKPRYREEDGKVIKPPTWQDPGPRLCEEIERQRWERKG